MKHTQGEKAISEIEANSKLIAAAPAYCMAGLNFTEFLNR